MINQIPRVSRSGVIIEGHKRLKETGVQKLFIIGIAPKIPENNHNCSIFLKSNTSNDIDYHFSTDLKVNFLRLVRSLLLQRYSFYSSQCIYIIKTRCCVCVCCVFICLFVCLFVCSFVYYSIG